MVKNSIKHLFTVLCVLCISACNIDFFGFVVSNDLDERLLEKDNLEYLIERGWTNLDLGAPDNYSFIVLTDIHIEDGKAFDFDKLKNAINPSIKFAAVLGDITQTGKGSDFDLYIKIADELGVPCYPVIGNHDIYFSNWQEWKTRIGSTSYRIDDDAGTATLFFLDSANSFFGKKQLDWLESQLESANDNIFVFTHAPLFINGPFKMQQITDHKERARVISMLKNKCKIMFMGHSHIRVENKVGDVTYVSIEDFRSTNVYCLVTVNGPNVSYKFEKLN